MLLPRSTKGVNSHLCCETDPLRETDSRARAPHILGVRERGSLLSVLFLSSPLMPPQKLAVPVALTFLISSGGCFGTSTLSV